MAQHSSTPTEPLVMDRLGDFINQQFAVYADCPACGHAGPLPLAALQAQHGNLTLTALRARLRCRGCGARGGGVRVVYQGCGGYTYRPRIRAERAAAPVPAWGAGVLRTSLFST